MNVGYFWDTLGNHNDAFVFISFIESGKLIKVSYIYIDYTARFAHSNKKNKFLLVIYRFIIYQIFFSRAIGLKTSRMTQPKLGNIRVL